MSPKRVQQPALVSPNLVACSGDETKGFFGHQYPGGAWDLVTFTFGGNDAGFASFLQGCLTLGLGIRCPSDGDERRTISDRIGGENGPYWNFLKSVANGAVSANGNIVVLGYPALVELHELQSIKAQAGCPFGLNEINEIRGLAGDLNATIGQDVAGVNRLPSKDRNGVHLTFVDVNTGGGADGIAFSDRNLFEPSAGPRHNLCSSDSWLNGFAVSDKGSGSFHPTQAGYIGMGNLLAEVLPNLDWSGVLGSGPGPGPGPGGGPGGGGSGGPPPSKRPTSTSYSGAVVGSYNHAATLSATLADSSTSVGLAGRGVVFTLGSQSCAARTDGAGSASCSITLAQTPGAYTVGASFGGDSGYTASGDTKPFTLQKAATKITYGGPASADFYDTFTATAVLTDPVDGSPIAGKAITLKLDPADGCSGVTDASGGLACSITPTQPVEAYTIVASFDSDSLYLASSDARSFVIKREETVTSIVAAPPNSSTFGHPVTFAAGSAADPPGGAPAPTGSTAFTVDGTAVGSSTLIAGSGHTATASLSAGSHMISAHYSGDHNFLESYGDAPYTVTCAVNITGTHNGVLVVSKSTCLAANARVNGALIVRPGGALDVEASTVRGAILATHGAGVIRVCGSSIRGSLHVRRSGDLVLIGDPRDAACAPNRIVGSFSAKANMHGLEVIDNAFRGAFLTGRNSGPGPYPGDPTTISGNHRLAAGAKNAHVSLRTP